MHLSQVHIMLDIVKVALPFKIMFLLIIWLKTYLKTHSYYEISSNLEYHKWLLSVILITHFDLLIKGIVLDWWQDVESKLSRWGYIRLDNKNQ